MHENDSACRAAELAERQQKLGFMMSRLRKACPQPAPATYLTMYSLCATAALTAATSAKPAFRKLLAQ